MKILLVNQHTVPGAADIAKAFFRAGHSVTLIAGYIESNEEALPSGIKLVRSFPYRRASTFSRTISWLGFIAHYSLHLIFGRRPDHILVTTNPPLAPIVTSWIGPLLKIPFHVLVLDLYPDALAQAGFVSQDGLLFRTWQRANRRAFRVARGIITLGEAMRTALAPYVDISRVRVISNWSDTNYIKPVSREQNPFVKRHELAGKCVVMYSGNMGLTHDLESLMDAAAVFKNDPRCVFILIGGGGKKKKLQEMKTQLGLTNVKFLEFQSGPDFPLAVAAADIGIVTIAKGAEGISAPSKTYVNMAAGQCLIGICPAESELTRIITEYNVGYAIEPGQSEKLASHIKYLLDHPESLQTFKSRAREASMKFTTAIADEYPRMIFPKS
jgi:glycosyltransferase involved in cell wall biosynthesis